MKFNLYFLVSILSLHLAACTQSTNPTVAGSKPEQIPRPPIVVAKGNEGGNGGDYITFADQSAWFVDARKPIYVCTSVSKNFAQSQSELQTIIKTAFASWREYMDRKQIYSELAQLRPSTDLVFLPSCDETTDLKFYFGTTNDEVTEAKARFFNPASMAIRTKFNEEASWGRGFIWVADPKSIELPPFGIGRFPDWNAQNNLLTILMHEIGHVLGNGHVEGTIMTENITQLLDWGMAEKKVKIDQSRELARSRTRSNGYQGIWSVNSKNENISILNRIFGEAPDDPLPGAMPVSSVLSLHLKWNGLVMPLTMTKGDHQLVAKIIITSQQETTLSDKVFRTNGQWQLNQSDIGYGYAIGVDGVRVPIVLEYNMNGPSPLTMIAFENGIRTEIVNFELISP